jgi:ubiquinone/menaquinone biosynthesis C-methylase UbiE
MGCGTWMLGEIASLAVGLDISKGAVSAAKRDFSKSNLEFIVGDANRLPFRSEYFDAIVLFETVEHVIDPVKVVEDCGRVMHERSVFICSTPNKSLSSPLTIDTPGNPSHLHEFCPREFEILMRHVCRKVILYGQPPLISEEHLRLEDFPPQER